MPGAAAAAWADAARRGVRDDEEALEKANQGVAERFAAGGNAVAAAVVVDGGDGLVNGDAAGTGVGNGDGNRAGADAGRKTTLAIEPLGRQEAVETGFGNAVRGLGRLKTEMPAVVARMERARKAGEYVVTER